MWDKVTEIVGPQFPVAILIAAWAMTTFVYYRRQHTAHIKDLRAEFAEREKVARRAHDELVAELRSQIGSLKRERARLRKELGGSEGEGATDG